MPKAYDTWAGSLIGYVLGGGSWLHAESIWYMSIPSISDSNVQMNSLATGWCEFSSIVAGFFFHKPRGIRIFALRSWIANKGWCSSLFSCRLARLVRFLHNSFIVRFTDSVCLTLRTWSEEHSKLETFTSLTGTSNYARANATGHTKTTHVP